MPLDTRIPLMGQPIQLPDFNALAQQRQQQQVNAFNMDRLQRQDAAQQAAAQRQQQIGAQAAGGDFAGAGKAALEAGDFDLHKSIQGLDDESHKAATQRNRTLAAVALSVADLPYEQRREAIRAAEPYLTQTGIDPAQIEQFDPTDEAIAGIVSTTQQLDQLLEARAKAKEPFTLAQGSQRYAGGKMIADNPAEPKYLTVPEGGTAYRIDGGGLSPAGGAGPTGATGSAIEQAVTSMVPGVTVTSGARSPQKNAMVGGVTNSYHLTDQARDFVPPKGMTTGALAMALKSMIPSFDVLNEGDHVHVEPGPQMGRGGPPSVIRGNPKPPKEPGESWTQLTPQEAQAAGLPSGTVFQRSSKSGEIKAVTGQSAKMKAIPAGSVKDYVDNNKSLRQIDKAVAALDSYPNAVGGTNALIPDFVQQRADPKGVAARAIISDIGSLIIHDRSGAAVTAAEMPRLRPFIPNVSDTAATVKKKLANLKSAIAEMQGDIESVYSEDQGYSGNLPKYNSPSGNVIRYDAKGNRIK